jgi:hypothetical protein
VRSRVLVGLVRFELTTPCSQSRCASKLRHSPILVRHFEKRPTGTIPRRGPHRHSSVVPDRYVTSMKPVIPTALLAKAAEWTDLPRWERKQLGMVLRRPGLTNSEVRSIIPVPSGTLSHWCRAVSLRSNRVELSSSRLDRTTFSEYLETSSEEGRTEVVAQSFGS